MCKIYASTEDSKIFNTVRCYPNIFSSNWYFTSWFLASPVRFHSTMFSSSLYVTSSPLVLILGFAAHTITSHEGDRVFPLRGDLRNLGLGRKTVVRWGRQKGRLSKDTSWKCLSIPARYLSVDTCSFSLLLRALVPWVGTPSDTCSAFYFRGAAIVYKVEYKMVTTVIVKMGSRQLSSMSQYASTPPIVLSKKKAVLQRSNLRFRRAGEGTP